MISRGPTFQDILDVVRNDDPAPHVHSELELEVNTIGIHVENHNGGCREFVIWTQLDLRNLGEKRSRPMLREDLSDF